MRPIDADALVEHLERWSEDYAEVHERLKNGDVSKAVMYGKFTALVETIINVKRMRTVACDPVRYGEWISVKDRLPEKCTDVLVYVAERIDVGYLTPSGLFWHCYAINDGYVTHWMPLPEPPEDEG